MGPGDVSRETPASETAAKWRDQVARTFGTGQPPVTWRDYQDIISHARHEYLASVQRARQLREEAIGPAFETFAASERHAWYEYHEVGRRAWLAYQEYQRATLQEPEPPAAGPIEALIDWAEAARPGTSHPYRVKCEYAVGCQFNSGCISVCAYTANQPAQIRDHPIDAVRPVPQEPFFTPRPESES